MSDPTDKPLPALLGTARDVLGALNVSVAPTLPAGWRALLLFAEQAFALGADLAAGGADPVTTITEMRRSLPDLDAAHQRVREAIDRR